VDAKVPLEESLWRELIASPAFLVYAAASWIAIAAAHADQPGEIVVQALRWYTVAAYVVFPFVVIAFVEREKARGGTAPGRVVGMFVLLSLAWIVGWIPGLAWLGVWRALGGRLYAPDMLAIMLQHLLRGVLAISLAMVAAAVTKKVAAAVLIVLAFALAVWGVDIMGQREGGLLLYAASLAPEGMLRPLEHGRIHTDAIAVFVATAAIHVAIAVVWLQPDKDRGYRWSATALIFIASIIVTSLASELAFTWSLRQPSSLTLPVPVVPRLVDWLFYVLFPALTVVAWWRYRRVSGVV
jgi:hypothetical protein